MSYYLSTKMDAQFGDAINKVIDELKKEGFGVLTDIDMKKTLKKKLDLDFPKYRILGACNPPFAYQALQTETKIGTMLPCNIVIRETEDGKVEVAAIDPLASMQAIQNEELQKIAGQIQQKLKNVIANL